MNSSVQPRKLTRIAYSGMFTNGIVGITVAPALPYLIREYELGLAIAGLVFPARSLGGLLGALWGGPWSDAVGRRTAIVVGALLQAISLAAIALSHTWFLSLLFFLSYGVGTGIMGASLNAMVAELNPNRRAAALNMAHGIYGLGSLLGPLGAGLALAGAFGWRPVLLAGGLLWLIYSFLAASQEYPPRQTNRPAANLSSLKAVLASPVVPLLFFVAFAYNGAATGLVGWISTYLTASADMPAVLGAAMISVFYAALTTGRIGGSLVADRVGHRRLIVMSSIGVAAFYPLAVFTRTPLLMAIGVGLSGLFFATLYPTALAHANALLPDGAGSVAAVMSSAMSLGAMSVPWLMGVAGDLGGGLQAGMALAYALILALVVVAVLLMRAPARAPGDAYVETAKGNLAKTRVPR